MLPFKKILFPVDYSPRCRAIVPYVEEMIGHFSAQLTVVRAYTNTNWLKQVEEQEERQLQEFVVEAFPKLHVDSFLEEGEPGTAIDKVVRHQGTDLVMLSTHGFGFRRRLLLGSVTAKILHDVDGAVWTAAEVTAAGHPREIQYKSLLCAVDFSDETEAVLRAAAVFASSYQAQLSLIHVVEAPPVMNRLTEEANDRLATWKQKLGIDAPHHVLNGVATEVVCGEAARQKSDLLIVGRGQIQGTLSRVWSRLYEIVRESPCPVLSI